MNKDTQQNDVVQIIRYVRPGTYDVPGGYLHDNMYGITLVFHMHVASQQCAVQWSVCNGDNFSKKEGIRRALESKVGIVFDYKGEIDLTSDFLNVIDLKYGKYQLKREDRTYKSISNLLRKTTNNLYTAIGRD